MPAWSENTARIPEADCPAPLTLLIQMARLGDFLQSTPLIRAVRQKHPNNRVGAVVTPAQAPLAHGCPELDQVFELEPGRLMNILQMGDSPPGRKSAAWAEAVRHVSGLEVDHIYNLNLGAVGGLLCRQWPQATPHAWRLHPDMDALYGEPWSPFIMAMAGKRNLTRLHLCDILSAYADPPRRPADSLCYVPPGDALATAGELVGEARPLVALQLGANSFLRRWPVEAFGELALDLVLQGARPVLVGSPGEAALGRRLLARLGPAGDRVIDLMGKTSLPELGAVLSLCKLVVSADTGTLHLATAVGARVLALFMGPAQIHETGPYGEGHLVLQARDDCGPCQEQDPICGGKAPCRRLIQPHEVKTAARRLLAGHDAAHAIEGLEFPDGVRPFAGRLGKFCQAYDPLRPMPLSAAECLALALKHTGLSLLYSAYRPEADVLEDEIRRAGEAPSPEQKKIIASYRESITGPDSKAEQAGLGFLATLRGSKAPPGAGKALAAFGDALEICMGP